MTRTTFAIGEERLDAATFAYRHPAWVQDPAALRALARAPRGLSLPPPPKPSQDPIFFQWRDEIRATAVARQCLRLGRGPFTPTPESSFGHGTAAFLPSSEWPLCGECRTPLELCCQLAPSVVGPWLHRPGALVLMYCFQCSPRFTSEDRKSTFLRMVEPKTLARRPAGPSHSSSDTSTTTTRGVEIAPPSWHVPDAMWFRYRLDHEDLGGAASILLSREEITAEIESGESEDEAEELDTFGSYEEWAEAVNAKGGGGDGALGGYPNWDQADATPECRACGAQMEHLLDWNGEQFLDGALHLFTCERTPACGAEFEFVAEF